jgi:GGDEF domain-containing protein
LLRLTHRRFRNFSEAADSVLGVLADAMPGVVALARLDPDEQVHRVTEARGEGVNGLHPGVALPPAGDGLDNDFLHSLGAQAWLSVPLEMSDGRIVGMLCAVDARAEAYSPEHSAQLGVASRLLSHEWEGVELRSEVRRLRRRIDAGPGTDPDTGLPSREAFLELLDREWRLAERGTVQSVLVVYRIGSGSGEGDNGAGDAGRKLALKVTAEVLEGSTRVTDRVGRIGEMTVGAILVGCRLRDAPIFVARFLEALGRVTEGRRPELEVSFGVQPLAGSSSEEVLGLTEAAAGESERDRTPAFTPGEARE